MSSVQDALATAEAINTVSEVLGASRIDPPDDIWGTATVADLITELRLFNLKENTLNSSLIGELRELFLPYSEPNPDAEGPEVGYRAAAAQVLDVVGKYQQEGVR